MSLSTFKVSNPDNPCCQAGRIKIFAARCHDPWEGVAVTFRGETVNTDATGYAVFDKPASGGVFPVTWTPPEGSDGWLPLTLNWHYAISNDGDTTADVVAPFRGPRLDPDWGCLQSSHCDSAMPVSMNVDDSTLAASCTMTFQPSLTDPDYGIWTGATRIDCESYQQVITELGSSCGDTRAVNTVRFVYTLTGWQSFAPADYVFGVLQAAWDSCCAGSVGNLGDGSAMARPGDPPGDGLGCISSLRIVGTADNLVCGLGYSGTAADPYSDSPYSGTGTTLSLSATAGGLALPSPSSPGIPPIGKGVTASRARRDCGCGKRPPVER